MTASHYAEDLESARRAVLQATAEKRPEVFRLLCREYIRWVTVGGVDKGNVVDSLREIGLEADLGEDTIQSALAEAVERPFQPTAPALSMATTDRPTSKVSAQLDIKCASDIRPEPIRWLWPERIAIGKQTILAGEPGLGKSQLTCWITAAVTTGGYWPGNEHTAPMGSVIILSAEDDAADTIVPRLEAAGADLGKVHIASAVRIENRRSRRSFNLQTDLHLLEQKIENIGDVRLVVIDPVSSYLGEVDSHRNAELRVVLEPIGEMASRLGVAVLSITHLSKSGGSSANSRFIGSIAFVAAARAAFIVVRDPDDIDRRLFLPTKNNLGPEGTGLGFRIGLVVTPSGLNAPTISWDTLPVTKSANEVLAASGDPGSAPAARKAAEDFLRELLADGPVPSKKIKHEANEAGFSWRTVRRAKEALGVAAKKTGADGGWEWSVLEGGQG